MQTQLRSLITMTVHAVQGPIANMAEAAELKRDARAEMSAAERTVLPIEALREHGVVLGGRFQSHFFAWLKSVSPAPLSTNFLDEGTRLCIGEVRRYYVTSLERLVTASGGLRHTTIGTAMLGQRVGDELEWEVPGGKVHLRVEEVLFQPEAAGRRA